MSYSLYRDAHRLSWAGDIWVWFIQGDDGKPSPAGGYVYHRTDHGPITIPNDVFREYERCISKLNSQPGSY